MRGMDEMGAGRYRHGHRDARKFRPLELSNYDEG
jgi:hypothetical protein